MKGLFLSIDFFMHSCNEMKSKNVSVCLVVETCLHTTFNTQHLYFEFILRGQRALCCQTAVRGYDNEGCGSLCVAAVLRKVTYVLLGIRWKRISSHPPKMYSIEKNTKKIK